MLYDFFIFLPAWLCLFWMVVHWIMARRSRTFPLTMLCLADLTLFFFADSCYAAPAPPPACLLTGSLTAMLALPGVAPLSSIYLRRLRSDAPMKSSSFIWVALPAVLFSSCLFIAVLAGPARIAGMLSDRLAGGHDAELRSTDTLACAYRFISATACKAVLIAEFLFVSVFLIRFMVRNNLRPRHFLKFFQGSHIRLIEIQFFLIVFSLVLVMAKAFLPREWLMGHPWISLALSAGLTVGVFLFSYVALFGAKRSVTIREMQRAFRYNYDARSKAEAEEEMLADLVAGTDARVLQATQEKILHRQQLETFRQGQNPDDVHGSPAAHIYAAVSKSWDDDSLRSRFERHIFGEKGFLEPGVTLQEVSMRLHTNKTYISRLVNSTYNLAFPDLVSALRIDFAQQYFREHPDARQDEVARACGFPGASPFNITFKKVVGMTPRVWIATQYAPQAKP